MKDCPHPDCPPGLCEDQPEIPDRIVEKAAKALWDFDYPHPVLTWHAAANDGAKVRYRRSARAALEAALSDIEWPAS